MAKDIPYDQKYYDPEIECMPRPELEALQLERLKDMVAYAYDNTVYYKRAFDEAGVKPGDIESLDDIAKFPFCDKKTERETQHVGSFFGEMCSVPEEEVIFMATSSGSTGVPTVSPFTQADFDLWQDTEARLFWQAGMRTNDRYVHGLNFALYVGGPDVIGAQRLGALAIWVGAVPSDRLLFVLKQYQPTSIGTSPSYAWHLGEIAKEKGFDPKEAFNIHTIIVAGEAGGSIKSTREARIHVTGRKDEMFIVGAVNVFPSDIEYVVRGLDGLTGEYSIRVYEKNFTCKYEVSVERSLGSDEPYDEVASRTEAALKAHTGVRPAKVIVYDAGKLGTSSEHKASRFIDERGCVTR